MLNKAVNPATLKTLMELQDDSQPTFFTDLVQVFLKVSNENMERLKIAVEGRQMKLISQLTHNLKSSAGNLGAEKLASLCGRLEHVSGEGIESGVLTLWMDLQAEYQQVVSELKLEIKAA